VIFISNNNSQYHTNTLKRYLLTLILTHWFWFINFISKFWVWSTPASGYSNFIANKTKPLINVFEMFFADWVGTFTVWTVKKLSFSRITFNMTAIAFQKRLQSSLYLVKLRLISIEHNISGFLKPRIKIKFFLYFCVIWFRHFVWMNSIEYFVRLYSTRSWKRMTHQNEDMSCLQNWITRDKKKENMKEFKKIRKNSRYCWFCGDFPQFRRTQ